MGIELLGISLTGWIAVSVSVSIGILAALMFILGSERLHYVWGLFCTAVSIWTGAFFFVSQATTPTEAIFWWKITYVGIILIPFTYFHFVLTLVKKVNVWVIGALYAVAATFLYFDLTTNLMIDQVTYVFNELYYNYPAGVLHPYLLFCFITLVLIAHIIGFNSYRTSTDPIQRERTWLFFLSTGVGFIGAIMNFFGVYGIFIHPSTNFTAALAPPVIAYTILRYHLFNMKVVLAQVLTLALAGFTVFRLIVSKSLSELMFNVVFLLITVIVGIYLVKSVRKEVEAREEIERLATNLEKANERLKELDTLKSQFLSIASHDLRAPLTAIRNFMSMLMDGTYGKLPPAAEEGTKQVFERATEMAGMVDNYLNVSRIEQGRMKYDFADMDLKDTLNEAIASLTPVAKEKGLSVWYTPVAESLPVRGDEPKLREVFENLFNNAINYTPKGSIRVTVEKQGEKVRITFQDTGIGMSRKTIDHLFGLFSQGEDSRKYNPKSTGVGLYITKAHVTAHRGTIRAESDGEGKGSRFIIELPLK